MRFLVDADLSPSVTARLIEAGFSARHVGDLNMLRASDEAILDRAAADGDVVVTADSDFGMLLASRQSAEPSVILLRHVNELRPPAQAALLIANLPAIQEHLAQGVIVSLSPTRLAVRSLPIRRS